VRRGWPTARISGRKRYLVTGTAGLFRYRSPPQHVRQGQTYRGEGIHLPPLGFPERRRQVQNTLTGVEYRLSAPRGDRGPKGSAIQRPQWAGISRCSLVGVAICQPPTEPIRQRFGTDPKRHPGNPIAAEPCGCCVRGHSLPYVEPSSTRNGTVES
jgi:hypothetical protein